jgi:hypothetical protein
MSYLTLNSTIVSDGLKLPLSQFQDKIGFKTVLTSLLQQVQELETAVYSVWIGIPLADAVGWALDQWGKLVGYPRPAYGLAATSDTIFRALIYGQIAANSSYGRAADIYRILAAIKATGAEVRDVFAITPTLSPSAMQVYYNCDTAVISGDLIKGILDRAKVPVQIGITEYYETDALALAGGAYTDAGLGIGRAGKAF